jgi:hypothetical protein
MFRRQKKQSKLPVNVTAPYDEDVGIIWWIILEWILRK